MDVYASVDPVAMDKLQRSIRLMEQHTRRDMKQSVIRGAIQVAISARAITKVGKKLRKQIKNPKYFMQKSSKWPNLLQGGKTRSTPAQFLIVVKHQNKPDTFLPTNSPGRNQKAKLFLEESRFRPSRTIDPRRKIKNRALAKNSFRWMVGQLGGAGGGSTKGAKRHNRVEKRLGGKDPRVTLISRLTYLEEAFPGITNKAINNGAKKMYNLLNKKVQKRVKSQFD